MFASGVLFVLFGYAMAYTGASNLANGGQGPRLWQSLGLPPITGPTSNPADSADSGGGFIPAIETPWIRWDPGIEWVGPIPYPRLPEVNR